MAAAFVLAIGGWLVVAPTEAKADGCPANQTCKHPCVVGKEFDTGTICNSNGWTCCETVPETTLTPSAPSNHTQAECQAQGGTCVLMGTQCPANTFNVANCDDISTTDKPMMCCGKADSAAASSSAGSAITLSNPLCPGKSANCITINGVIGRFIDMFLGFVGAIALLVFVYAGVMYMTGGSGDRVKKAIDTMKYAVLGLVLIMFAYIITSFFFKALTSDVPAASKPKNVVLPQSQ